MFTSELIFRVSGNYSVDHNFSSDCSEFLIGFFNWDYSHTMEFVHYFLWIDSDRDAAREGEVLN